MTLNGEIIRGRLLIITKVTTYSDMKLGLNKPTRPSGVHASGMVIINKNKYNKTP